jgi:hypothetical protein
MIQLLPEGPAYANVEALNQLPGDSVEGEQREKISGLRNFVGITLHKAY